MAVIIAELPNFPAFSFSLSPPSLFSILVVSPFLRCSEFSSIKKKSFSSFFFFFSIKEEGEIEINRGLIIKSGY